MLSKKADWKRWAAAQAEPLGALGAPRTTIRLLKVMVEIGRADGSGYASAKRLGAELGLKERQTRRLLAWLVGSGLVASTPRWPGEEYSWQLNPDGVQLSLLAVPQRPRHPVAGDTPTLSPATPHPVARDTPLSNQQTETDVYRERGTRAGARDPSPDSSGLQVTLVAVLEILGRAPRVVFEELSVNAMLAAHPPEKGYDHVAAANIVLSWALQPGGVNTPLANVLLQRAFVAQARAAGPRASQRPAARDTPWPPKVGVSPVSQADRDRWRFTRADSVEDVEW